MRRETKALIKAILLIAFLLISIVLFFVTPSYGILFGGAGLIVLLIECIKDKPIIKFKIKR